MDYLEIERRRISTNVGLHYKEERKVKEVSTIPEVKTNMLLIDQVRKYFKPLLSGLEYNFAFEGRETHKLCLLVWCINIVNIAVLGAGISLIGRETYKESLLVILLAGFHLSILAVFYISKNSDFALVSLLIGLLCQFFIFSAIIIGGLSVKLLIFCYMLKLMYVYATNSRQNGPIMEKALLLRSWFRMYAYVINKMTSINFLFGKLVTFILIFGPIIGVLCLLEQYFDLKQTINRQIVLYLFLLDLLVIEFSTRLFRVCRKYRMLRLGRKFKQMPLYLLALAFRDNQQQEIAALEFVLMVKREDKLLREQLHFRMDDPQVPTVHEVIMSYFERRIVEQSEQIHGSLLKWGNLQKRKLHNNSFIEDLSIITTFLYNLISKQFLMRTINRQVMFYAYLSNCYKQFTIDSPPSSDLVRHNYNVLKALKNQKAQWNPKTIRACKCILLLTSLFTWESLMRRMPYLNYTQMMNEKLPIINQRPQSGEFQSPFRYPSDEEVFLFRENERIKKQEAKTKEGQHIWDKKTASNRTQLKHFKNYEPEFEDHSKVMQKVAYTEKERKVISEALQLVKDRQKARENGAGKESIVNLIEQKKEMFLVAKAHGIIKDEIEKLKLTSTDKQDALDESKQMLRQDDENFQKYVEASKQQKLDAELKAEQEIKEKKAKEAEIKSINAKMTSLRAEKSRNEEAVNNYMDHKKFLDKLAPKEWTDLKERKRMQVIEELREQYLKSKSNSERQFMQLIDQKKFDELDDFEDEYDMYFKGPQQLVEIFSDLEERNLFLIQTTQDAEQNLEELKANFGKVKVTLDEKVKTLQQTKDVLRKGYDNVFQWIRSVQIRGTEKDTKKDHKELRKQIIEVYEQFQQEIGLHDHQSKETLEILVAIELQLEKQLKQIRAFKPDRVEFYRLECDKEWKIKQREDNNLRIKLENERRIMNDQAKIMQPSKKKTGRQAMFRSKPFDKVEQKEEETVNNEELEDQKYFME